MVEYDELIERVKAKIKDVSESKCLPDGFLSVINNMNGSTSLWIVEPVSNRKSKMIFSMETRGKVKHKYLSVLIKTAKTPSLAVPESAELVPDTSNKDCSRLNFRNADDTIMNYLQNLIMIYVSQYDPSDKFGCCHRYKECSAERRCIHPDQFYSKACWYRKNLENGKVFFESEKM